MSRLLHEVLCTAPGDDVSKAVVVSTQAPPSCPEDGVVVAVAARPINPADLLLLQGRHVFTPTLPTNVGIEGAGVVVEAGARSQRSRVMAVFRWLVERARFRRPAAAFPA